MPRFKEKPEIHFPKQTRKRPSAPALSGFPKKLPSALTLIKWSTGAVHITG